MPVYFPGLLPRTEALGFGRQSGRELAMAPPSATADARNQPATQSARLADAPGKPAGRGGVLGKHRRRIYQAFYPRRAVGRASPGIPARRATPSLHECLDQRNAPGRLIRDSRRKPRCAGITREPRCFARDRYPHGEPGTYCLAPGAGRRAMPCCRPSICWRFHRKRREIRTILPEIPEDAC